VTYKVVPPRDISTKDWKFNETTRVQRTKRMAEEMKRDGSIAVEEEE
jgi:hypothetical protein